MDASDGTMRTVVTVRPTTTQAVTLNASASRVIYGRAFTLSGTVSSRKAGEDVNIVAQRFGESSFTALGTVKTGEDGDWSFVARPTIQTAYQARWRDVSSGAATVGVRPLVALRILAGVNRFSTRVVAAKSFAGRIARFQKRNAAGQWITKKFVRLDVNSKAVFRARLARRSTSAIRVFLSVNQAGPGYLSGISRTVIYHRG
jgi:O-acetylhomoserine/O-acetylserine sulfhydrylase-like pyridoxal-dependent enzyme